MARLKSAKAKPKNSRAMLVPTSVRMREVSARIRAREIAKAEQAKAEEARAKAEQAKAEKRAKAKQAKAQAKPAKAKPVQETKQAQQAQSKPQLTEADLAALQAAPPLSRLFAEFIRGYDDKNPLKSNQPWMDFLRTRLPPGDELLQLQEEKWAKRKSRNPHKLYEHLLKKVGRFHTASKPVPNMNLTWRMHVIDRGTPDAIQRQEDHWYGRDKKEPPPESLVLSTKDQHEGEGLFDAKYSDMDLL